MANKGHFAILQDALKKEDISIWNQWREENPDVEPNLSWAYLIGANLSEANLRGTILSGAKLWQANLTRTKLWRANLTGANLHQANLLEAYLTTSTELLGVTLPDGKFWRTETDMSRYTNPEHPKFWHSD